MRKWGFKIDALKGRERIFSFASFCFTFIGKASQYVMFLCLRFDNVVIIVDFCDHVEFCVQF